MIGTAFGIGTPFGYPQQLNPYSQQFLGAQGNVGAQNPNLTQTLQQAVQLLQVLPQQLQQLQQLQQVQFVQCQQLQQLLQAIPYQLQQLQQGAPYQQQSFGQIAGTSGPGISTPWGIAPAGIGAQPSHVM